MNQKNLLLVCVIVMVAYWWPSKSADDADLKPSAEKFDAVKTAVKQVKTPTHRHNPFAVSSDESSNAEVVHASTDTNSSLKEPLSEQTLIYAQLCADACRELLERIDFPFSLTDSEFEDGLANTEALAEHLKLNPQLVDSWIELASFAKGNKRSLVLATFSLLDIEHQEALGLALLHSTSYAHRMDAVQLLSADALMSDDQVALFAEQLMIEPNAHVRSALVKALNQPNESLDRTALIASLEQVRDSDADYAVRGEALLATVDLQEYPQLALDHALAAVHSDVSVFQEYGAQALQAIVARQSLDGIVFNTAQQQALAELKDNLMQPAFDQLPSHTRALIDNL